MNQLLYGSSISPILGRSRETSVYKSSGIRTPAPQKKVLRWKDVEVAAAAVEEALGQTASCRQSVFGSEQAEKDLLMGGILWDNEDEELFV